MLVTNYDEHKGGLQDGEIAYLCAPPPLKRQVDVYLGLPYSMAETSKVLR